MALPLTRTRIGILAGAVGAAGALTLVAAGASGSDPSTSFRDTSSSDGTPEDISGPCDEAEHANDPQCAGVPGAAGQDDGGTAPTTPTTPTTRPAPAAPSASTGGTHTLPTAGGTVTYTSDGSSVSLVSAVPANGWRVEVEQSSGREVELDFRAGSRRVQVNLEIEHGQVRERVRVRDDATGTDVRVEDGTTVRDGGSGRGGADDGPNHDVGDDHGGDSGSGSSGSGHGDDSSGSGSSDGGGRHSGGSDDNPHPEDD